MILGSSNDYCGVYNDGVDQDGAPIPSGPIWLGYYRSQNGGESFRSSLVPGYPDDSSPYASLARQVRTATAGDPVIAWDNHGRAFFGAEASGDPAGSAKTFGDEWVARFRNPQGQNGPVSGDGLQYYGTTVVAKGSAAPNLLGVFNDKTAIEADRTGGAWTNRRHERRSACTSAGVKSSTTAPPSPSTRESDHVSWLDRTNERHHGRVGECRECPLRGAEAAGYVGSFS